MFGKSTIITGIEDGPDGMLKVYVGARYLGYYVLIEDPEAQQEVRHAWGQGPAFVFAPLPPPEAIYHDEERPYVSEVR